MAKYQRVLLKLSGEILKGKSDTNFDEQVLTRLAGEVCKVVASGTQLFIVVGAGNIFRHATHAHEKMERVTADYMGMLGTLINALALQDAFERVGVTTRVMSAIESPRVVEPFIRRRAIRHVEKGRVVILAAGTGNPFFTTDSAAVLRAAELKCEVVLKGTKVDGIYDSDPRKNPKAKRYDQLSYQQVVQQELAVMDLTAFTMAQDNGLPIIVFDIITPGNLERIIAGESVGTTVSLGA